MLSKSYVALAEVSVHFKVMLAALDPSTFVTHASFILAVKLEGQVYIEVRLVLDNAAAAFFSLIAIHLTLLYSHKNPLENIYNPHICNFYYRILQQQRYYRSLGYSSTKWCSFSSRCIKQSTNCILVCSNIC